MTPFGRDRGRCHIGCMATKRLKRPRDPIARAKLIGDIATGQIQDMAEDERDHAAVILGAKGGKARAANLSKKKRTEIARRAAKARWKK
jgi:hypothetical protein